MLTGQPISGYTWEIKTPLDTLSQVYVLIPQ